MPSTRRSRSGTWPLLADGRQPGARHGALVELLGERPAVEPERRVVVLAAVRGQALDDLVWRPPVAYEVEGQLVQGRDFAVWGQDSHEAAVSANRGPSQPRLDGLWSFRPQFAGLPGSLARVKDDERDEA